MRWIKQIRFPPSLEHVGNNYSRIFYCLVFDAYFYFLFQGDGNIPHNVNENHRSSVYFIIRGKKKKKKN